MAFASILAGLPIEYQIAWRYVTSNAKQSLIVMLAVGIGVALIVFMPSVNDAFYGRMLNRAVEKSAQITITREIVTRDRNIALLKSANPQDGEPYLADKTLSRKRNIKAYRTFIQELLTIPGVLQGAPFVGEQVIVVRGSKVMGGSLRGIVPEMENRVSQIYKDVSQGDLSKIGGNQVFLGWRLAKDLGVTVGSRVMLVTSKGARSFKVVGLLNSGLSYNDEQSVVTDLRAAQRLLRMSNEVSGIGLKIMDPYQANEVASFIHQRYGVKAKSWMEVNKLLLDELEVYKVIMAFINFLIVFAAASSITSVLIMVVSSKAKEIGILKAMGMSPGQIIRLFMVQAMFLSILGALAGVALGVGITELYNASPAATAETAYGFSMEPVPFSLTVSLTAVAYSLASSFLASLVPAWQASRLDPIKAIQQ